MNLDFNRICRLCLRLCVDFVDLRQNNGAQTLCSELREKINFCYRVKIDLTDGLPTKVCYQCIQVLSYFYATQKNVVSSEQLLRDVIYMKQKLKEDKVEVTSTETVEIQEDSKNSNTAPLTICNKSNVAVLKPSSVNVSFSSNYEDIGNHKERNKIRVSSVKKKKHMDHQEDSENILKNKNQELRVLLEFRAREDLQKWECTSEKYQKAVQGNKRTSNTKIDSEGKVVKVIGTVIDQSNILSPNVKRTRKSVLTS